MHKPVGRLIPVTMQEALLLVTPPTPQVVHGKDGRDGLKGDTGADGGAGKDGADGRSPESEVKNGEIRFKQPNGEWGDWIRFSTGSGGGLSEVVHQREITGDTIINHKSLLKGHNILRVTTTDPITITLPASIDEGALIVVNDETGVNSNIIITTEV